MKKLAATSRGQVKASLIPRDNQSQDVLSIRERWALIRIETAVAQET
jgi:hypothetical protein